GRRQEGAVLPVAGDDDPLAEQRVVAHLRRGVDGAEIPEVGVARGPVGGVAAVDQLPPVGQRSRGLLRGRGGTAAVWPVSSLLLPHGFIARRRGAAGRRWSPGAAGSAPSRRGRPPPRAAARGCSWTPSTGSRRRWRPPRSGRLRPRRRAGTRP